MDADGVPAANGAANCAEAPAAPEPPVTPSNLPEVEAYAYLVTLMFLVDHKQYQLVRAGTAIGAAWRASLGPAAAACWQWHASGMHPEMPQLLMSSQTACAPMHVIRPCCRRRGLPAARWSGWRRTTGVRWTCWLPASTHTCRWHTSAAAAWQPSDRRCWASTAPR